jgi:hypothetical protein
MSSCLAPRFRQPFDALSRHASPVLIVEKPLLLGQHRFFGRIASADRGGRRLLRTKSISNSSNGSCSSDTSTLLIRPNQAAWQAAQIRATKRMLVKATKAAQEAKLALEEARARSSDDQQDWIMINFVIIWYAMICQRR